MAVALTHHSCCTRLVALQAQCKHLDTASQAVLRLGRLCVLIAADRVRSPTVREGIFRHWPLLTRGLLIRHPKDNANP